MTKQPPINKADWRSLHFLWDIHLYSWWNFPSHHLCLCLSNSYPRGYYQTPDVLNRFPLPLRQMLQGVSIIWTPGRWPLMAPNLTWDGTKVHQDQGSIYWCDMKNDYEMSICYPENLVHLGVNWLRNNCLKSWKNDVKIAISLQEVD